jgi:hypothetical protein
MICGESSTEEILQMSRAAGQYRVLVKGIIFSSLKENDVRYEN